MTRHSTYSSLPYSTNTCVHTFSNQDALQDMCATIRKKPYLFLLLRFTLLACMIAGSTVGLTDTAYSQEQSTLLRLLQPSRGERLTPGGEYLILWTGVSSLDTVQLSFSIDSGKTWKLITSNATGLAYRWSPIPFTVSESCSILVNTKPRENSVATQSTAYGLSYGKARPSPRWLNRWSGFSFDGSKILTISSLPFDDSTRQTYQTQVWDAPSGRLLYSLPDYLADTTLRFAPTGITPRSIQTQFSPDNALLLNVLSDSTFGIFDASNGRLQRTIRIPREGFNIALQSVSWSTDGREISARILVREQGSGASGTVLSDKFVRFSLSDLSDRPIGSQFSKIEFDRWGSTYLGLLNNRRQWLAMRRRNGSTENAAPQVQEILLYTPGIDSARRFVAPANYSWKPETLIVSPNDSVMALMAVPINSQQNLPNLLALVNLFTGVQRTRAAAHPVSWSSDSRSLIIFNEATKLAEIVGTDVFTITSSIQNLSITPFERVLGMGNIIGEVQSGIEQIRWENNGRRFIGYEASSSPSPSNVQTLGFWDAATGCQTERFALPRVFGMAQPLQYPLSAAGSFIANVSERQYIVNNNISDTALVITTQAASSSCQTAISDGFWSIRLPNVIVTQETLTIPTLVCETTATARFTVTNLTNGALILESSLQSLSGNFSAPSEFSLVQTTSRLMPARAVETVIVRYTPERFGDASAQMVFTDVMNNVIARTLVLARKDSLAFEPPAPLINLGNVPANTILTTTVTIRNTGNTPLQWSTAATRSTLGNVFITTLTPNPTPVGASAQVTVRVQPVNSLGIFQETLPIYFCGSSTSTAFVQARVLSEFQQIDAVPLVDGGILTCENSIERPLRIRNTGGKPLTITSIGGTDENFSIVNAPTLPFTILPLDSVALRVRLTTQTNGVRESQLIISSNDPVRQIVNVTLRVQRLAPTYLWTPSVLLFERIDIGSQADQTIDFTNNAQSPLFWELPRRLSADFSIIAVQPNPTPNGSISRVTIRFNGSPASGLVSTTAVFNLRDICNTETQLGLEAITIQPAPKVIVRNAVSFETLLCETERLQQIQILNAGRRALRIDSAFIESSIGAGRSATTDFLLRTESGQSFPTTIAGVDSNSRPLQLNISFRPRNTGLRENWLVLHSNDTTTSANGIIRVRLSGVSETAGFSLSPSVLRFITPADFLPVRDSVLITNTGTKPLVWQGFPRILDSLFTIERIEPSTTAPGSISKAIIRFAGIRRTENIVREFTLTNALCNVTQTIRFAAGIAPQGTLGSLRDVSVRLLCENERRITIPLENIGTATLTMTEQPRFLNDTLREATILQAPASFPAGTRDSITILLRSQNTGTRALRLQIRTNDPVSPITELRIVLMKDSSALRVVPPTIDFGNISDGTPLGRSITIENNGTIEQRISLPLHVGNLSLESLTPNPIPAGGRATGGIRFTPVTTASVNGLLTESFSLRDSCARENTFTVNARITDGEIALPDSIKLAPLGEVDVPIVLRRRSGIAANTTATFRLRIANTSLLQVLAPLQAAQGLIQNRVENGVRILRFSLPVPSVNETEPLVTMRLRGLLGSDSVTTLTLDSAFVGGTPVRGTQSRFQTLGLNYSGGKPRLYFTPLITLVAPNPATDNLSVKLSVQEASSIVLRIVNVLGQATELFAGSIDAGERDFRFDLSHLPTGTYLLELRSSSLTNTASLPERTSTRIQIVR